MLNRPAKHPKPATIRKREQRDRDRREHAQIKISVHRDRLIEALLFSELATADEALDPAKVRSLVEAIVNEWVARWLKEKSRCD